MRTSTCPECGATYRVLSGGHCRGGAYGGCCRTYSSDRAATAHRKGPFEPPGQRFCVDHDDDYDAKGRKVTWRLNRFQEWTNQPELSVEAIAARGAAHG